MASMKNNFAGHNQGASHEKLMGDLRRLREDIDNNPDPHELQRLSPASKIAYKKVPYSEMVWNR
jgi:hypothetical protein